MGKDRKHSGLIYGVTPEEFEQIKDAEEWFINYLSEGGVNPHFFKIKYNPQREAIGIFYKKGDEFELIPHENSLSISEDTKGAQGCFERIKDGLERKLDLVRLPKEEWKE